MYAGNVKIITKTSLLILISLGILCAAACQMPAKKPTSLQVAQMLEANVTGVFAQYDAVNPYIWTEDETSPRGIIVKTLYMQGPDGKGVFGDGVLRPKLYAAVKKSDDKKDWQLVKEWTYEVEDAIPFRSKRQTVAGWGYRFYLLWGDDLDLANREIRLIISFERRDGIVVTSRRKDFRVPRRGS